MARKIRQQICANCSHSFKQGENFCPNCGQENHSPNQPIRHYIAELIESLIHLDSKMFLTLKTMLLAPGKITREYNENMRARYTPPVRLYVFISLIFFILLQIPFTLNQNKKTENNSEPPLDKNTLVDSLSEENTEYAKQDSLRDSFDHMNLFGKEVKINFKNLHYLKNPNPDQIDSLILKSDLKPNYFTRTLYKQFIKSANADEDFVKRIIEKSIKFGSLSLFLLMPLFALLISLSYFRLKKFYYDYLIFSIHYHSVIFMVLSLTILFGIFIDFSNFIYFVIFLGLLYYFGKALRYNYQGTRKRTILKMLFIFTSYFFISFFVFVLVVILGWWFV